MKHKFTAGPDGRGKCSCGWSICIISAANSRRTRESEHELHVQYETDIPCDIEKENAELQREVERLKDELRELQEDNTRLKLKEQQYWSSLQLRKGSKK